MAQSKIARPQHRYVNERGRRIGEPHPRAKLTKQEIALIADTYEELTAQGKTAVEVARTIAKKFEARWAGTTH